MDTWYDCMLLGTGINTSVLLLEDNCEFFGAHHALSTKKTRTYVTHHLAQIVVNISQVVACAGMDCVLSRYTEFPISYRVCSLSSWNHIGTVEVVPGMTHQ